MPGSFFIVGSGRSGTTALVSALGLSTEAVCLSEPVPHLNEESRWKFEGFLADPHVPLARDIGPRLAMGLARAGTYIEKQISLVPLMRELHELHGARFIVPYRDGREVVTSLMNWHHHRYPIIYRETAHDFPLSGFAAEIDRQVAARGGDSFDYSLPRPTPGDPYREDWPHFSRFEMCCWYWNAIHDRIFAEAARLPQDAVFFCDTRAITAETVAALYRFCGLGDFDAAAVQELLDTRVNALSGFEPAPPPFPRPDAWSDWHVARYFDLCWRSHRRLGLSEDGVRPLPAGVGQGSADAPWRQQAAHARTHARRLFAAWRAGAESRLGLRHVLEPGTDASGAIVVPPGQEADLVLSLAAIDNAPDPDAFLQAAARAATRALFVTTWRGYAPALRQHRIATDLQLGATFNDLSPAALVARLRELGFATAVAVPYATGREDTATETALLACREAIPLERLLGDFPVERPFRPYAATPDPMPAEALALQVNRACAYYSDPVHGRAADPALFRQVLRDLKAMPGRRLLPLRDFAPAWRDDPSCIGLRVDIDDDLVAAVTMAEIAQQEAVRLTFFLLPTAPYYGRFATGAFHRHEAVAGFARRIQDLGHEIGLHADPFLYARDHGLDGNAATVAELDWLRAQGLRIGGISGHNCASYYGAESVEVFARFRLAPRKMLARDGLYLPLGTLDADALGIAYEGSFFEAPPGGSDPADPFVTGADDRGYVSSMGWMRRYLGENGYARYAPPTGIWVTGRDEWVMSHRGPDGRSLFRFRRSWAEIVAELPRRPGAALLVLHPNYFGRRAVPEDAPREGAT